MRRAVILALTLAAAGLATAAQANASVPDLFFGMTADGPLFDKPSHVESELRMIRGTGVGTIREAFDWSLAEPARGTTDYALSDFAVTRAARTGLRILPVVLWAPEWARRDPGQVASPPEPTPYTHYLTKLVRRYGPSGAFWRAHPNLPKVPIREWQIWNEPTVENFWTIQPWQHAYATLLRRSRKAVRKVDSAARIVTAGFVYESWEALEKLYDAGGGGAFDVLALHPFTNDPSDVLRIIRMNRKVLQRHDDSNRPIFLTEVSWPSSLDKIGRRYGYETTESGMADKIREAYPLIAHARKRLHIERAYWYTWVTREQDPSYPFDYAGLRKVNANGKIVSKPGLAAFRETLAKLRH